MNKENIVPIAVFLLRVVASIIFIEHGGQKLFGWFGGLGEGPLPTSMLIAGILEFFGGIAILLGLFTRPVAFILSGEMAVAYFTVHIGMGNPLVPMLNGGEPAALLAFIFLFLSAYGGGAWALDQVFRRKTMV